MTRPVVLSLVALLAATAVGDEGVTPSHSAPIEPAPLGPAPTETIRQRDAEGRVRVMRDVRQNDRGDYVNHGAWRCWDAQGQLVGQGRYAWGEPCGVWSRWASRDDSPLLSTLPFIEFDGPFLSQANYEDGKLEGDWSIFDAGGRLVSRVPFRRGQRHGTAVLRTASDAIYRRARFDSGLPTGTLEQRSDEGELGVIATYQAGRRIIERVERYESQAIKSRESWLGPVTKTTSPDDPWRIRLAQYAATGDELRHGSREAWWPNGQRKLEAEYRLGQAVGRARWWHANGQLALQGAYENGLATGPWSWWRESGVRAASCEYLAGKPADWKMWTAEGRRKEANPTAQLARRPSANLIR